MIQTVAVVDDSESSRQVMGALLRTISDCEAVFFGDSGKALAWCLENEMSLIVVDYVMPPPNGLQFIEAFRKVDRTVEVPILMVTTSSVKNVRYMALQMGATDFLMKPVDEVEFIARVRNLLGLHQSNKALADRSQWLADEVRKATVQLLKREREALLFLARAAEHRDPETGSHIVRMASYSRLIAEKLGLDHDRVEAIHAAAPLHDLGKIGIPDRILLKPGRLSADELAVMRQHCAYGHEILADADSPLLQTAAEIALCHHEHFDGQGYPNGIAGADIPHAGRIVAIADVFDALTSIRPYKRAWSFDDACRLIEEERGTHFDPECADAFLGALPEVREVFERNQESWCFPSPVAGLGL